MTVIRNIKKASNKKITLAWWFSDRLIASNVDFLSVAIFILCDGLKDNFWFTDFQLLSLKTRGI